MNTNKSDDSLQPGVLNTGSNSLATMQCVAIINPDGSTICTPEYFNMTFNRAPIHLNDRANAKQHLCVLCRDISFCDVRFNQKPVVLIAQLDLTTIHDVQTDEGTMSNVTSILQKHKNSKDSTEKPYICIDCGKGLCSIHQWKIHMMHHCGVKPYFCVVCYKQFWTRKLLLRHSIIHCPPARQVSSVFSSRPTSSLY